MSDLESARRTIVEPAGPSGSSASRTARLLADASPSARRAHAIRNGAIAILLIVIAAVAYIELPQIMKPATTQRTLSVRKRRIASALHEIGTVSAHVERPVLTRFSGEIIWRAEDGTLVETGDPVVIFDSKVLQDEIELKEKDLSDKVDEVERAERNIRITRQKYQQLVRQKEIDLQKAQLDRKKTYEYPIPDELLDVELTWKSAAKEAEQLQVQADGLVLLGKQGFASDAQIKKKQLELATAKAEAARSKLIYDLTRQGKTPELKRVDDVAVADATKALNVAKFNADADIGASESALELARIELGDFQRELKRKKMRLDAATVRSPMAGRVIFQPIYKGSEKNRSPIQAGETRPEGSDLCTLLDTSSLVISLWINEMDIGNVVLGQKARVLLPAMPGKSFNAEVVEIAVTAQDKNMALSPLALRRSGEAFVNVVRVKLVFSGLTEEVKNHVRVGFTADVRLFTGNEAPALSVPWQAIAYAGDGTPYADVPNAGKLDRRVVKLGRSDNAFVEIVEGLSENMSVIDQSHSSIPFREEGSGEEAAPAQNASGKTVSMEAAK